MKKFLIDYRYQFESWSFELEAETLEEAQAKLNAIKGNGTLLGEIHAKIFIPTKWMSRLWQKLKLLQGKPLVRSDLKSEN